MGYHIIKYAFLKSCTSHEFKYNDNTYNNGNTIKYSIRMRK